MLNVELENKLKELGTRNSKIAIIFRAMKNRNRDVPVTDLRRFRYELRDKYSLELSEVEIIDIFKEFQRLGCGNLKLSRKENDPPRFHWEMRMVNIGRIGLGEKVPDIKAPAPMPKRPIAETTSSSSYSFPTITIAFPFRGDVLQLEIPKGLSKSEANDIADFIRRFGK